MEKFTFIIHMDGSEISGLHYNTELETGLAAGAFIRERHPRDYSQLEIAFERRHDSKSGITTFVFTVKQR